jgi:hypothetical protein
MRDWTLEEISSLDYSLLNEETRDEIEAWLNDKLKEVRKRKKFLEMLKAENDKAILEAKGLCLN